MAWGSVEVEPEVAKWLEGLSDDDFGHAAFYVDLLGERGVELGEPYTRQLRGNCANCGSMSAGSGSG